MARHFLPILVLFLSCTRPAAEPDAIPQALQDGDVVKDFKGSLSGRGYNEDLVDALFNDVLEKEHALDSLLKALDGQNSMHRDSTRAFHRFEGLNRDYYAAAAGHTSQLSDSLEGERQRSTLDTSEARYRASMATLRELNEQYNSTEVRTSDLVVLLKLQRTLELMERYQQSSMPGNATLRGELARITALEQRLRAQLN